MMDVYKTVYNYINGIFTQVSGMKALLMDSETTGIIGVVYSQSEALMKDVLLTENIDTIAARTNEHNVSLTHLTAMVIIQPTEATLHSLITLINTPRYNQYHLFFTNIVSPAYLDRIASADINDHVKSVYE